MYFIYILFLKLCWLFRIQATARIRNNQLNNKRCNNTCYNFMTKVFIFFIITIVLTFSSSSLVHMS